MSSEEERVQLLLTKVEKIVDKNEAPEPLTLKERVVYGFLFTVIPALVWSGLITLGAFLQTFPVEPWFKGMWLSTVVLAVSHFVSFLVIMGSPKIFRMTKRWYDSGCPVNPHDPPHEKMSRNLLFFYCLCCAVFSSYDSAGRTTPFPLDRFFMGTTLVFLSFIIFSLILRENQFALFAALVDSTSQKFVQTGPYGVVRHPTYATLLPLFLGLPLTIGSYRGMIPFLLAYIACACLTPYRERLMIEKHGNDYKLYQQAVPFKVIPGIF